MSRNTEIYKSIVNHIRSVYQTDEFIPLHVPKFNGREKEYLLECIDSTFVSSVGKFVTEVEVKMAEYIGAKYAVATVNGTSALHLALRVGGVEKNDEVITQALTFVATCNAIRYQNAHPVFVDISEKTLGMSKEALEDFLINNSIIKNGECFNKKTGRRIKACLPMHTFGHPVELDEIRDLCIKYKINLIEDSAESIGSYYKGQHTGNYGIVSAFSFNGNKTITCGGGGILVTNDEKLAKHAKHLSTVAKAPHKYDYYHDELAYNYRMPNLNAALLLAQLEQIDSFLDNKRELSEGYSRLFKEVEGIEFVEEPINCKSNFWLNAVLLDNLEDRNAFLDYSNDNGVMTRPVWKLMTSLPEFKDCERADLSISEKIENRLVNIPSSVYPA